MIKDIEYPLSVRGEQLDTYLQKGWYRLGQAIFTTDYIPAFELHPEKFKIPSSPEEGELPEKEFALSDFFYRVYWLRFFLDNYEFGRSQKKLIRQNREFSFEISPFQNDTETEALYRVYRASINFDISPSLRDSLLEPYTASPVNVVENIFDTWMIRLRFGKRLIAIGIFDKGSNSTAGIINFYHPKFSRYSLGKYLMLLKIRYAKENGIRFYYPGYISPDYPKFDYKLYPGKHAAEIFDPEVSSWTLMK